MSQLSLTYLDVDGDQKSITHIMQDFADVKSFVNGTGVAGGGNLDATNTAAAFAKDNVEPLAANWKTIYSAALNLTAPLTAATYYSDSLSLPVGSGNTQARAFDAAWIDPVDLTAGSRTTKYRVAVAYFTNGTAPGTTFTFGLYPVTCGGGSGVVGITLGTVVASSTAAIATPSANTPGHAESSSFTAPTAGAYGFGVVTAGSLAANSSTSFTMRLQAQQV